MTATAERKHSRKLVPLELSRVFPAPREMVFQAWSSAEHLKRWFSPKDCSLPEAEIDFRAGGAFSFCMLLSDGQLHWGKGHFTEVAPPDFLTFTTRISADGEEKLEVRTRVTFTRVETGTRMSVYQEHEIFDPAYHDAVQQATEGWRTTLDKLEAEIERIKENALCHSRSAPEIPAERSVVHGSFTLKRVYDAAPSLVFRALTDPQAKARWFSGGEEHTVVERVMDVRPGGRERLGGRWRNGTTSLFDAVYFDVVPNARLVYAYEMHLNGRKISVSLATMQLKPAGAGTQLTVTEQGSFLDGYDDAGSREHGTGILLDQLGASLRG